MVSAKNFNKFNRAKIEYGKLTREEAAVATNENEIQ